MSVQRAIGVAVEDPAKCFQHHKDAWVQNTFAMPSLVLSNEPPDLDMCATLDKLGQGDDSRFHCP